MRTLPASELLDVEESNRFADEPQLFVLLDVEPVVFTLRGIAYLRPRLQQVGVELAKLSTAEEFRAAYARWEALEAALFEQHLRGKARPGVKTDPSNALLAIVEGDDAAFAEHLRVLEHQARSGLRIVGRAGGDD